VGGMFGTIKKLLINISNDLGENLNKLRRGRKIRVHEERNSVSWGLLKREAFEALIVSPKDCRLPAPPAVLDSTRQGSWMDKKKKNTPKSGSFREDLTVTGKG